MTLQHAAFDPSDTPGDVFAVTRIAASGGWRLSDANDHIATIGLGSIDAPGARGTQGLLTYDAQITLVPEDAARIDLGVQRFTLDSEPTLRNRVAVDQFKASADLLPTEPSRLTARVAYADYTDGNRQWWWQAEFEQRLALIPRIHAGARNTGTNFA